MERNDGDGFTLALESRDGVPVMILNGVELEPERAWQTDQLFEILDGEGQ